MFHLYIGVFWMTFQEGYLVGNYEIVGRKPIGRGSFSRVFLGKIQSEVIAIKVISLSEIGNLQHRLKYEIEVMKTLQHENVVNMREVIYQDDQVFLILDYCQNGDLHKFLNGRPLKEKYARFYLNQMADGLKYLYDRQIIHRDLKPQNLLLNDEYVLKITDFGFAKYFDKGGMSETICGTPLYMAPEIMKFKKYSIKSDLWSVGVILYEMVVGRTPYKARNHMELLHKINTQPVIVPFTLEISEGGKNLINKLLQKNPKDRINWNQFFNHPWLLDEIRVSIFSGGSLMESQLVRNKEIQQFQRETRAGLSCSTEDIFRPTKMIPLSEAKLKKPLLKIIDDYSDAPPITTDVKPPVHSHDDEFYSCDNSDSDSDSDEDDHDIYHFSKNSSNSGSSISFSDGDEDVIFPNKTQDTSLEQKPPEILPKSTPISISLKDDDLGIRYSQGRILTRSHLTNDKRDLFLPIVDMTPRKENGFVVVNTPKEYDIITDILANENRNLSESLLDYMGDTYNYLRSFIKSKRRH